VAKQTEFKLNVVDKMIGYFNPQKGVDRAVARHKMFHAGTAFRGADRSLLPGKFRRSGRTANEDLQGSLVELRKRSRDLHRNNALAVSARETMLTDVLGSGLKLESNIDHEFLNITRDEAQKKQADFQRRFHNWASSEWSDIERTCNFYEKQLVIFGAQWDSGDVFINLPIVNSEVLSSRLRVEVLEADRVNSGKFHIPATQNVFHGVKLDNNGAPLSYFVEYERVIGGQRQKDWKEVRPYDRATKARKFLHLYEQVRPGQTRGYPRIAAVLTKLKELDEYVDAEIRAAVVAGLYTVFVTSNFGDIPGIGAPVEETASGEEIEMGYGSIVGLAEGEDISSATPGRPNPNAKEFAECIQADIATGMSMPYEVLVKRFNSSYSASRAALLEHDKMVQRKRQWFADRICKPVYRRWLDDMVLQGKLDLPGYFSDPDRREAWLGSEWIGPTFREIDPVKPAQAALLLNKLGVVTLDRLIREQTGGDFSTTHTQLVYEYNKRLEDDLIPALEQEGNEGDISPDEVAEPRPAGRGEKKAPQTQNPSALSMTSEEATRLITELSR